MADFYPVLKKAIAGLPAESGPEKRAELYEKSRAALLRQLQARQPALSEGEIMRQRLSLEEVIRRIEREADSAALAALEALAPAETPGPYPVQQKPVARSQKSGIPPAFLGIVAAVLLVGAGGAYMLFGRTPPTATTAAPASSAATPPSSVARTLEPAGTKPAAPEKPASETAVTAKPAEPNPTAAVPKPAEAATTAAAPAAKPTETPPVPKPEEAAKPAASQPSTAAPQAVAAQPEAPKPDEPAQPAAKPADAAIAAAALAGTDPAPAPAQPASGPIPVAVRASIYEPPASEGQRATERRGALIWRETASSDAAKTPAISGSFEFPDLRLNALLLIEKNADPALPASHNVSLLFSPMPGATVGVREVLSVEMREDLQKLGVRLDGVRAQPIENMVMIGLSSSEPSVQKNIPALREQPWVYVDLVFTDGRRGAMIFEKGSSGTKVFNDVFRAWGG